MNRIHRDSESEAYHVPRRHIKVKAYLSGSESPSDAGSEIELTERIIGTPLRFSDISQDCLLVIKTVKFLKIGRPDGCATALASLLQFDLLDKYTLYTVCEEEGLDMLVNLCEVDHMLCRLGALKVLRVISKDDNVAIKVVDLGIVPILLSLLTSLALDILENAVEVLANVGHLRRASKALRRLGGIPILVTLLKIKKELLVAPKETLTEIERNYLAITKGAARALWMFSRFTKNKIMMYKTGIITPISEILLSGNRPASFPISGILSECSNSILFQLSIETGGLVGVLVENLTKDDPHLQWSSAYALMRTAEEKETVQEMIRFHEGLPKILDLIRHADQANLKLMQAAIGALWKSAILEKNVEQYESLGAVECLVRFIDNYDMEIKINAVGGLAEMAKTEESRKKIIASNVIPTIVGMLISNKPELLENAAQFVGKISLSPEGMEIVEANDGVRLLWSLLRSKYRNVQLKTLWAVKSTVRRASDGGEQIRQLTGALELLVTMLKNTDVEVLTGVAAVIGEVALDRENLAILTEQGVVRYLSALVRFKGDNQLARELCAAIAHCGNKKTVAAFGRQNVIPPLVPFLLSKNPGLKRQACRCFCTLSREPRNCVTMHVCCAVPALLQAAESSDPVTQLAAAGCMSNIRRTLYGAGLLKTKKKCTAIRAVTR